MELFEFVEKIIGHLAWPIAAFLIVRQFGDELRSFIKRIKSAKYKDVQLDLEREIKEIKNDAESAGITINYPPTAFPRDSIQNLGTAPELAFMQSWQELENALMQLYSKSVSEKNHRGPTIYTGDHALYMVDNLVSQNLIDPAMGELIKKLKNIRNKIVHSYEPSVTRGEALEWLGITKSVKDRILQKL